MVFPGNIIQASVVTGRVACKQIVPKDERRSIKEGKEGKEGKESN